MDASEGGAAGVEDERAEVVIAKGEVLGAVVDAAVHPALGGAASAEAAGLFEEDGRMAGGLEGASGGDTGEAGAEDGDARGRHGEFTVWRGRAGENR